MRRRSVLSLLVVLVLLTAGAGTALALLVRHVPTFYSENELTDDKVCECRFTECDRLTQDVWNMIGNGLPWRAEFTQEQLNGYLRHELSHTSAGLIDLPDEVHDIRVALDADRIRIAGDALEAAIKKKGYVSGVEAASLLDKKTGALLGAHMVGAEVTELIQGYVVAMNLETTEEELMHTIFPHPTLSEMMKEAVLDAYGRVLNM